MLMQPPGIRTKKSRKVKRQPELMLELHEVLKGRKCGIKIYSKTLGSHIYFVNPDEKKPVLQTKGCPVYTTSELAFILSLTREELKRYHYFKTALIEEI